MNEYILLLLQSLWLILPAYIANPVPVVVGGKTPVDFGRNFFDKRPVFGPGKTWRGSAAGITAGTLAACFQILIGERYGLAEHGFVEMSVTLGLLLSAGAILGDIVKSFFKRRIGVKRGAKLPLADQLDFLVGALLLASLETSVSFGNIAVLFIITPFIHRLTNIFAYRRGLKSVPW
ncbi:MAG: CDP-2,3-bis-(O-geranylgeranyl)-sn-glycerol synthase [Candidatus Aenigmarchaeota archaeon]|nr:CDP-2,3-bis-(O-geranylgeranyl)-sn-glycerol synthase [Candidatus Aenigmarchaeota archaeon]